LGLEASSADGKKSANQSKSNTSKGATALQAVAQNTMFVLQIGPIWVVFLKFLKEDDRIAAEMFVGVATQNRKMRGTVLLLDIPPTLSLFRFLQPLVADRHRVVLRCNKDVDGNPMNERQHQTRYAAEKIRRLLREGATISNSSAHPACSLMIAVGEFADAMVVIAHPNAGGLMAAMKAGGVVYKKRNGGVAAFDNDAEILSAPRSQRPSDKKLSKLGVLLDDALASLPPFDSADPSSNDKNLVAVFGEFVAAVKGEGSALKALQERQRQYAAAVKESERIAQDLVWVGDSVVLVHAALTGPHGVGRFDLPTLTARMASQPGVKVVVVQRANGPIAPKHGLVQYSVYVAKHARDEVNLEDMLPNDRTSFANGEIVCTSTTSLYVSQRLWEQQVLPALQRRLL
jgi:hypothetical protein